MAAYDNLLLWKQGMQFDRSEDRWSESTFTSSMTGGVTVVEPIFYGLGWVFQHLHLARARLSLSRDAQNHVVASPENAIALAAWKSYLLSHFLSYGLSGTTLSRIMDAGSQQGWFTLCWN